MEHCAWCGAAVEPGDGFRVGEHPGARHAAFCRLEHMVPWAMHGAHWDPGDIEEPPGVEEGLEACARCAEPLGDVRVVAVRHRGEGRIADAFCGVDHLREWSLAGGRWG